MTDLATKYPVGTRVRVNDNVLDEDYAGATGAVVPWNEAPMGGSRYVRVKLDESDPVPFQTAVIEELTGEPGLLFEDDELEIL